MTDRQILIITEEFYKELYKSKTQHQPDKQPTGTERFVNVGSEDLPDIEYYEVEQAIQQMKTNEALEKVGILIEIIYNGGPKLLEIITSLLNMGLHKAEIPSLKTVKYVL